MENYDEFLLKTTCFKEGHQREYKEYIAMKNANLKDIEFYKSEYEKAVHHLKKTNHSSKSLVYKRIENDVLEAKINLENKLAERKVLRPNRMKDINERLEQGKSFVKRLATLLPEDIPLQFYATSLVTTERILKSGVIPEDIHREYYASTSAFSEVADISSFERSLDFYADLYAYQKCLPAGCVFVLKKQEEVEVLQQAREIDLKENPERFVGIITTTENIARVKKWMRDYGYNENFLYTYTSFLKILEETKLEMEFDEFKEDLNKTIEENIDPHYEPEGIDDLLDKIEKEIVEDTLVQMNIRK